MFKKIVLFCLVCIVSLPSVFLHALDSKLYRWEADWQWIDEKKYHYNFSCSERYYIINSKNFPAVRGNIIQVYLDIRGVRQQFITLNRKYWWDREYFKVGYGDWGRDEITSAHTLGEAVDIILDDAVRSYIKEKAPELRKAEQANSDSVNGTRRRSETPSRYPSKQEDAIRALKEGQMYFDKGEYIRASFAIGASLSIYETAEARELKALNDKKIAEMKAKKQEASRKK